MQITFNPTYTVTPKIVNALLRIEAAKGKVAYLPLTPVVLRSLRQSARLYTTHYSTMIEGNRLNPTEVAKIVLHKGHFPGRERDEREVKGYYMALEKVEQWAAMQHKITEHQIQLLHALVLSNGKSKMAATPYRDGQNVIRDSVTRGIVYLPPEAKDVPRLMSGLVHWINSHPELACPLVAGITHYQFATIHPYYDGNGRTARLLTTLILHLGGYDLKGLYSLEEYYARNLAAYYEAISVGDSHNYYMGRAEADITKWVEYFVEGMATACEHIFERMNDGANVNRPDQTELIRRLDPQQRKALQLFQEYKIVTSHQIGELFGYKPRTSAALCAAWVEKGFLEVVDPSNRGRKYTLAKRFCDLIR